MPCVVRHGVYTLKKVYFFKFFILEPYFNSIFISPQSEIKSIM